MSSQKEKKKQIVSDDEAVGNTSMMLASYTSMDRKKEFNKSTYTKEVDHQSPMRLIPNPQYEEHQFNYVPDDRMVHDGPGIKGKQKRMKASDQINSSTIPSSLSSSSTNMRSSHTPIESQNDCHIKTTAVVTPTSSDKRDFFTLRKDPSRYERQRLSLKMNRHDHNHSADIQKSMKGRYSRKNNPYIPTKRHDCNIPLSYSSSNHSTQRRYSKSMNSTSSVNTKPITSQRKSNTTFLEINDSRAKKASAIINKNESNRHRYHNIKKPDKENPVLHSDVDDNDMRLNQDYSKPMDFDDNSSSTSHHSCNSSSFQDKHEQNFVIAFDSLSLRDGGTATYKVPTHQVFKTTCSSILKQGSDMNESDDSITPHHGVGSMPALKSSKIHSCRKMCIDPVALTLLNESTESSDQSENLVVNDEIISVKSKVKNNKVLSSAILISDDGSTSGVRNISDCLKDVKSEDEVALLHRPIALQPEFQ